MSTFCDTHVQYMYTVALCVKLNAYDGNGTAVAIARVKHST